MNSASRREHELHPPGKEGTKDSLRLRLNWDFHQLLQVPLSFAPFILEHLAHLAEGQ